jgi:hypothetical protein
VLRLLDSCQLSAKHLVATPVNWKQGEDVIIVTSVTDNQAKERLLLALQSQSFEHAAIFRVEIVFHMDFARRHIDAKIIG